MPKKFIAKYFSDEDLSEIEKKIAETESKTSGELRLCIKVKRGIYECDLNPREIAVYEFYNQKMHLTKGRTGVMIFILFDERKFEVIADVGIYKKIPNEEWDVVRNMLSENFKHKKYKEGILEVIDELGSILIKEFPSDKPDLNELSNEVVVK